MAEGRPKLIFATEQITKEMLRVMETCESRKKAFPQFPTMTQNLAFLDLDAQYYDNFRKQVSLFAVMWSGKLGCIDAIQHRI